MRKRLIVLLLLSGCTALPPKPAPDVETWGNSASYPNGWDSRPKFMSSLIKPGSHVVDLGAGKMALKGFLPKGCTYTPVDLAPLDPNAIACNLDESFPEGKWDVAVCSGLLEYLWDVPSFLMRSTPKTMILSYSVSENWPDIKKRRRLGWVNDYSEEELCRIIEYCGYQIERKVYCKKQIVIKAIKK